VSKQLKEGIDFYFDADGFMVLTEAYHLENENVPEPRRSELSVNTARGLLKHK